MDNIKLISPVPERVLLSTRLRSAVDLWHLFTASEKELGNTLPNALNEITCDGMVRVSWPKKLSGVISMSPKTQFAKYTADGAGCVKVCAVDEVWSGLKLCHWQGATFASGARSYANKRRQKLWLATRGSGGNLPPLQYDNSANG